MIEETRRDLVYITLTLPIFPSPIQKSLGAMLEKAILDLKVAGEEG